MPLGFECYLQAVAAAPAIDPGLIEQTEQRPRTRLRLRRAAGENARRGERNARNGCTRCRPADSLAQTRAVGIDELLVAKLQRYLACALIER